MRRISSNMTFFYKRVFPAIWFGFLALFIATGLASGARSGPFIPSIIVPAAMMVFGYFIMKKLVFSLVDEVSDTGDALLIKNKDQVERVPLSEIINVSYSQFMNPPQVTLTLRRPSLFGTKVTFCAPVSFLPALDQPRH
jgi:hypothetical protein